jgi:hypothetical protein
MYTCVYHIYVCIIICVCVCVCQKNKTTTPRLGENISYLHIHQYSCIQNKGIKDTHNNK